MKTAVDLLIEQIPSLNLDHVSVCFTLRERGDRARRLWTKNGMPTAYAARLSEYWKKRAVADPELARRLVGLYLEHYSKSGDPLKRIDCSQHPAHLDLEGLSKSPGPFVEKSIRRVVALANGDAEALPRPTPPPLTSQIASATTSFKRWASKGLKLVAENELERRKSICFGCEFWDPEAFQGTGRCLKCGCSTWAKLRMATEACPIGKWGRAQV